MSDGIKLVGYSSDEDYFHNYLFPHNEKRTYRNRLTLVDGSIKYLGVTIKDKTNRHWEVKKPIPPVPKDWYHIYQIKGERWYFKKEQPDLLIIHADSKYMGFGPMPIAKKSTLKETAALLRKSVNVEPKSNVWKLPLQRNVKEGKYNCCYCELPLNKETYTKDHLIPKDRGGKGHSLNLRPCCYDCNQEKGNLMLHSYIQFLNMQLLDKSGPELIKLQTKIANANKIAKEINNG